MRGLKKAFYLSVLFCALLLWISGCGKLWGGISRHTSTPGGTSEILGIFVGAIGNTTATTGTCPAAGAASSWCTGGTFGAGAGDGMFNNPRDIAVDNINGFLYVTEFSNHRVVKLNLSTGAFVGAIGNTTATTGTCPAAGAAPSWCTGGTFGAGAGDGMFNGPNGVAVDNVNGFLYVTEFSNHRVVKLNLSTGAFVGAIGRTTATTGTCPAAGAAPSWCTGGTFFSAAGDGKFNSPQKVAVDTINRFLYVVDSGNNRIQKFR